MQEFLHKRNKTCKLSPEISFRPHALKRASDHIPGKSRIPRLDSWISSFFLMDKLNYQHLFFLSVQQSYDKSSSMEYINSFFIIIITITWNLSPKTLIICCYYSSTFNLCTSHSTFLIVYKIIAFLKKEERPRKINNMYFQQIVFLPQVQNISVFQSSLQVL